MHDPHDQGEPEEESEDEYRLISPGLLPAFDAIRDYYDDWAKSLLGSLTEAVSFKLEVPLVRFTVPEPPAFAALNELVSQQLREAMGFDALVRELTASLNVALQPQWQNLFETLRTALEHLYPENWEGITPPSIEELETLLIDEGIPLMWVPGPDVVETLLKADDAAARRRIIGRRWRGITSDCEAALSDVVHPDLQDASDFAFACIDALRDRHDKPAQALAANLLDSLLRRFFDNETRIKLTKNNFKSLGIKFDLNEHKARIAFTFAPVWCAHAKFHAEDGDPIPRNFGRHVSVHGVSRAQYSKINAVIALMLVTSVIKFLDVELS